METTLNSANAPGNNLANREQLVKEIRQLIVDSVQIQHIPVESITEATTLFGEGLGLDSVDVLEVVVAVERKFGVKVRDAKTGQQIFRSVGSIADFVAQNAHNATASSKAGTPSA